MAPCLCSPYRFKHFGPVIFGCCRVDWGQPCNERGRSVERKTTPPPFAGHLNSRTSRSLMQGAFLYIRCISVLRRFKGEPRILHHDLRTPHHRWSTTTQSYLRILAHTVNRTEGDLGAPLQRSARQWRSEQLAIYKNKHIRCNELLMPKGDRSGTPS